MLLQEKLTSISPRNIVSELQKMPLESAQVSIDWYGRRVVAVAGFEGSITIDALAQKYLEASFFTPLLPMLTEKMSEARLDQFLKKYYTSQRSRIGKEEVSSYLNVLGQIHKFYETSNTLLQKSTLYRFIIPFTERLTSASPFTFMEIITCKVEEGALFTWHF